MPRVSLKPTPSPSSPATQENKEKAIKFLGKLFKDAKFGDQFADELFEVHEKDSEAFNTHLRMLLSNLKKNQKLKDSIEKDEVTVKEVVGMNSYELADDEVKKLKNRVMKDEEDKKKPLDISKIPDHEFSCPKCSSRKIQETQVQLRSADEPMTRILTCANCGFGWKRSC
ncbi:transcription elongation factor S-II, putative [Entamoeba invadens IP1]|uniref:Transcription elongation factor S-II, putative n=1 Tax=Entamoeba invadens IP1 TaxID=370355 RepID=A0A0A1U2B6_ENTIV|nr:transcription elongation factor S-II, putative [Entamoeba invadens IP1]ELP88202.1 transcription elongation factor S-II, putative [Entamoeba invadens IP1]|eukprot:XP_004254973.1 transcription elongation factor S-II, putative [Entamoeba invadens IP1]